MRRVRLPSDVARRTRLAICVSVGAVACAGDRSPAGAPRTLSTRLPRAEGVGVGTRVLMAGVGVGTVRALDSSAAGVRLVLEIAQADAPLHDGVRAEVRPSGPFAPDVIALVPGPAAAPPLGEGAEVPGSPRAATAAERRAAMRFLLPAIGLPALGELAGDPPRPESAGRAPHP